MMLPARAHTSQPWRVHALANDFRVEDVWKLPTPGGREDLDLVVRWFTEDDGELSLVTRVLMAIRWRIGAILGWDEREAGAGRRVASFRDRLPADLREGPRGPAFATVPMESVYLTDNEWVAEICNKTVHALMHIGWVGDEATGYNAQMAVLVKPNGWIGKAYMAAILPVRRAIVYPALMRTLRRDWRCRLSARPSSVEIKPN